MFAVLDLETTGPDPAVDRIVQVGLILADGPALVPVSEWQTLVNPGRPIPPTSTAIHTITDEMVQDAPTFETIAPGLLERLRRNTIVGYGCLRFDIPCLVEEFNRVNIQWLPERVIDVGAIYMELNPRTLAAAVKHYTGTEHDSAHNALGDARATRTVFEHMWVEDLAGKSIDELETLSRRGKVFADPFGKLLLIDGKVCFGTRRNEGIPVAEDLGYARWMLRSDFPESTKRVLEAELDRIDADGAAAETMQQVFW